MVAPGCLAELDSGTESWHLQRKGAGMSFGIREFCSALRSSTTYKVNVQIVPSEIAQFPYFLSGDDTTHFTGSSED